MRGRFITFEGPEGGGKTTQSLRLVDRLRGMGRPVVHVREPGGTPLGEKIRSLLQGRELNDPMTAEAELLLFSASRAQLVRRVIRPALDSGVTVVCDRFLDSTTVYQGYGRGLSLEFIAVLHRFVVGETLPYRTLVLDVDVDTGRARLQRRREGGGPPEDRLECEDRAFHERVREGFLELARREPGRIRVIDAGQDPDRVAELVWEQLRDVWEG